ncbi:MAG TPA: hypothetical protein PK509_03670 [Catalimonadaceae bacterium]|nr:hypothetical protein [Catalimonadaceae bacterium]HPI09706.1 hypothetical protein [Catalimonadaceae bacterium]
MGKYIRFTILYAVLIWFAGCQTVPEYPVAPSISFGSVNFKDFPPTEQDIIYLTIKYKDGDGDLGLSNDDLNTPQFIDTLIVDGKKVFNKNHHNIFIEYYRKDGNQYKYDTSGESNGSNGIFPRLLENEIKSPIEGSILYQIKSFYFFGQDSSIVKIKVHIQDRALHKSNTIETPPFSVINKP